jgi:hypothetical protein
MWLHVSPGRYCSFFNRFNMHFFTRTLLLIIVTGSMLNVSAQKTFSGTGNWSNPARWSGGSLPLATDNVVMASDAVCTLDVNATCASLEVVVTLVIFVGVINIGNNTLTVTGAVTGAGTITSGSGTLNIGGDNTSSGTFTPGTGTVNYNGSGAQTVRSTTYYNLTVSNAGTKTAAGGISIVNNMTIAPGVTFNAAASQITRSGAGTATINVNGIFNTTDLDGFSGSTLTAISSTGTAIVMGSSSVVQYAAASNQTISARADYAKVVISGNSTKTPAGNITLTGDLDVTAGTFAVAATTVTVGGNLTGAGTVSFTTGTLNLAGNYSNNGTFTPGSGTFVYNGTGSQSVRSTTYSNLTFSNAGAKTFAGPVVITGGRTLLVNPGAVVNSGTNQVTATAATATITINGTYSTANLAGLSGSTSTAISSTNTTLSAFTTTSTIRYNAPSGNQVVTAFTPYGNVTLSGAGSSKTTAANFTMLPGTVFTLDSGVFFDAGTRNFQNSAGTGTVTFNINGIYYTRLQAGFSGGATSINSTGTTINLGSSSVIWYGRNSAQSISGRSDYAKLRIDGNSVKTLTGPVTVSDSLNSIDGSLELGGNVLTLNGRYGGAGTLVGSATSGLALGGAGGAFTISLSQASAASRSLSTLTYNRSGQLITIQDSLNITGTITPTAGTLVTNGKLRLVSNASGTARIATGSGTYITGSVIVERYIPAIARRFRFLATTVTNTTLRDWQQEIFITGTGTGNTPGTLNSNGFDATLSNAPGIYTYDETLAGAPSVGFVEVTNNTSSLASVPLVPGRGYRVFIRGDRSSLDRLTGADDTQNEVTLNLNGPVVTGNIVLPVTYTNTGVPANDGWNLMGNSYPSQYNWDAYYDAAANYTNVASTIYIYDPAINNYKSFNAVSNTGTLTNGIIPAGAAFYFQTTGTPAMTFTEAYKTASAPASVFKTGKQDYMLTLRHNDQNYDMIIIKYVNEAFEHYDPYDIRKMHGPGVNLAVMAGDEQLSAHCKPFNGEGDLILLHTQMRESGTYTFESGNVEDLITGIPVLLIDLYAGRTVDLRTTRQYSFNVDMNAPATYSSSRFRIVVGKAPATGLSDDAAVRESIQHRMSLAPVPVADDIVYVTGKTHESGTATIRIYDAGGRVIAVQRETWEGSRLRINLSDIVPGVYFISVGDLQQGVSPVIMRCVRL